MSKTLPCVELFCRVGELTSKLGICIPLFLFPVPDYRCPQEAITKVVVLWPAIDQEINHIAPGDLDVLVNSLRRFAEPADYASQQTVAAGDDHGANTIAAILNPSSTSCNVDPV